VIELPLRVTGWHGLFPSWEGLGVGPLVVKSQRTPLESLEEASNPSHTVFSQTPPFRTETPF